MYSRSRASAATLALTASLLTASLTMPPAMAHHSVDASFDKATLVRLDGVVDRIEWVNPHMLFGLDVTQADGTQLHWTVETAAPNALIRFGLSREFIQAGERIAIEAWAALDGSPRAHLRVLRYEDGRVIEFPEDRWSSGSVTILQR